MKDSNGAVFDSFLGTVERHAAAGSSVAGDG
jgi:hypothetical protein